MMVLLMCCLLMTTGGPLFILGSRSQWSNLHDNDIDASHVAYDLRKTPIYLYVKGQVLTLHPSP